MFASSFCRIKTCVKWKLEPCHKYTLRSLISFFFSPLLPSVWTVNKKKWNGMEYSVPKRKSKKSRERWHFCVRTQKANIKYNVLKASTHWINFITKLFSHFKNHWNHAMNCYGDLNWAPFRNKQFIEIRFKCLYWFGLFLRETYSFVSCKWRYVFAPTSTNA